MTQTETKLHRVYFNTWATEYEVLATSQEEALEIAQREYTHLHDVDEIGVS